MRSKTAGLQREDVFTIKTERKEKKEKKEEVGLKEDGAIRCIYTVYFSEDRALLHTMCRRGTEDTIHKPFIAITQEVMLSREITWFGQHR